MAKFSRKHSKMKKPRDKLMIGLSPERVSKKKLINMAMIKLRQNTVIRNSKGTWQ